jgi:hypothetical protein
VQLRTNLALHLWPALVDPTQIELVVLNLALIAQPLRFDIPKRPTQGDRAFKVEIGEGSWNSGHSH